MAKKVTGMIKLQVQAGKANPAPPIDPALGQHGVNIPGFCKEFNERTKNDVGLIIPVVITVYSDRSFTFITKTPPVPVLIKKALGIESGSGKPNKSKVGQLTMAQVREIAEKKMPDLNAGSIEAAMSMVKGTARSMGVIRQRAWPAGRIVSSAARPREAARVRRAGNCGRTWRRLYHKEEQDNETWQEVCREPQAHREQQAV